MDLQSSIRLVIQNSSIGERICRRKYARNFTHSRRRGWSCVKFNFEKKIAATIYRVPPRVRAEQLGPPLETSNWKSSRKYRPSKFALFWYAPPRIRVHHGQSPPGKGVPFRMEKLREYSLRCRHANNHEPRFLPTNNEAATLPTVASPRILLLFRLYDTRSGSRSRFSPRINSVNFPVRRQVIQLNHESSSNILIDYFPLVVQLSISTLTLSFGWPANCYIFVTFVRGRVGRVRVVKSWIARNKVRRGGRLSASKREVSWDGRHWRGRRHVSPPRNRNLIFQRWKLRRCERAHFHAPALSKMKAQSFQQLCQLRYQLYESNFPPS